MGDFAVIRPKDDPASQQSSQWCDDLVGQLIQAGHNLVADVDDYTPPSSLQIDAALKGSYDIVFYFGHGNEDAWLTNAQVTIDASNISSASGKTVVSIACKTGQKLGPNAITAGVNSWLGFTIKVPVLAAHKNQDPLGDAIAAVLAGQAHSHSAQPRSMQRIRDDLVAEFKNLAKAYDTGNLKLRPEATVAYFALLALSDHVVVHGNSNHVPL
jgi:hypothetical protein